MTEPIAILRLDASDPGFGPGLEALVSSPPESDAGVEARVRQIIDDVRRRGDAAVLDHTCRLDRLDADSVRDLFVSESRIAQAWAASDDATRRALETAAGRIRDYHTRQLQQSWSFIDEHGTRLGQQVTPLERVGLYVPGGKAAYPSSVLMNAIPAAVAGVSKVVLAVPAPDGVLNELVLAAARVAGVTEVLTVGGAQAVAALAYGTESIERVDKIVGPGNAYVATAKRLVFGQVGIDMIAGPSEILIVSDGSAPADWTALDLFSQAEHDEDARAVLVCPDGGYIDRVADAMARLLPRMERADIIRRSLTRRGALIRVENLDQAVAVANRMAPEHLELSVGDPDALLPAVRNAGAIFMGRFTAEALGDYCAGPNHVLPTGGTARFSSPLGVYDFQKRSSVIHCTPEGARALGGLAAHLARGEALTAHARSAEIRSGSE
ncbi:MAG TPA: histidinol dehydrogenase [Gammaproteobacteria bacterium]|nr:histidinol dehydrogenase [Gammaproteobacteria bacterium]